MQDRVEVHPGPTNRKWVTGTVLAHHEEEDEYQVQLDMNDRGDVDIVHARDMRRLRTTPHNTKRPTITTTTASRRRINCVP